MLDKCKVCGAELRPSEFYWDYWIHRNGHNQDRYCHNCIEVKLMEKNSL
jgi:hypothetical protein